MSAVYRRLVFPVLARLDAETAHHLTLTLLRTSQRMPQLGAVLSRLGTVADPRLRTWAFGLDFANPVGLAAGFDKDGDAVEALAALGFGHVEIGTGSTRSASGKPKTRA